MQAVASRRRRKPRRGTRAVRRFPDPRSPDDAGISHETGTPGFEIKAGEKAITNPGGSGAAGERL
jgi:hypothetical protein